MFIPATERETMSQHPAQAPIGYVGKRLFDIFVATTCLLLLSPLIGVTAILVRSKLGSPVIFSQKRPGLRGGVFTLYKFRSMREAIGAEGRSLPDEERLTNFGKFLRASSLDELPELWNVLRGDMSLVGPRPLLVEYLPLYSPRQARRHEVRPGITGWAQVNGRNALSWDQKFELDVWYLEHCSLALDIQIIFRTLVKVTMAKDINDESGVGQTKFTGS